MWHHGITQIQHSDNDNDHNDDDVMRASVWLKFLVVYLNVNTHDLWEENMTKKEWDLNWEHPFPRVSGYERRSDIKKVEITEITVPPPPEYQVPMFVFGSSTNNTLTCLSPLRTFAYVLKQRHSLVCWNLLSLFMRNTQTLVNLVVACRYSQHFKGWF